MARTTTAKIVINYADDSGNVAKVEAPIADISQWEDTDSDTILATLPYATVHAVDDAGSDTGKTIIQTSAGTNVTRIKNAYTDVTTREYVNGYEPLLADIDKDED